MQDQKGRLNEEVAAARRALATSRFSCTILTFSTAGTCQKQNCIEEKDGLGLRAKSASLAEDSQRRRDQTFHMKTNISARAQFAGSSRHALPSLLDADCVFAYMTFAPERLP